MVVAHCIFVPGDVAFYIYKVSIFYSSLHCSSRAIQSMFSCCLCLKREDGIICMVHFYIADDFTLGLLLCLLIPDKMLASASTDYCNVETFAMLN